MENNELIDYAKRYTALGWYVLPVHRDSKLPTTRHGVKDASNDETVINHWFKSGEVNIAVAVGKSGFGVLDVDPRHGGDDRLSQLIAKHGPLPETVMQMTGGGGEHYLFRVPEGFKISDTLGKEFLGPGETETGLDGLNGNKYFIVEPSIHPHTGERYEWEASSDPFEGMTIADAPAWILESAKDDAPAQVLQYKAKGFLPPERIADLRSALSFISPDDYHTWVSVGQALHSSESSNAFGVWDEWSQKSDKYNPGEMRKKWNSFGHNRGLNVESIFTWAEDAGWANPAKYKAQQDAELQALVDEKQTVKRYEAIDRPEAQFRPIPVKPLAELCNWFNQQLPVYHLQATQACVLSLACTLATRGYRSLQGDPAHCYFTIVADSIGHVRKLKALSQRFLSDAGHRAMIRSTRITSAQTIYKTLMRSPACHYVADDFGQMLNFAKRQPSGLVEQALSILTDIYTQTDIFIDHDFDPAYKDLQNPVIYSPGFTLLALLSDDQVPLLTRQQELGRGALEQMIVIEAGEMITNDRIEMAVSIPVSVQEAVNSLQTSPEKGELSNVKGATLPADPRIVQMESGTSGLLSDYDRQFIELTKDNRQLIPLAMGARVSMRRLIVALAAWDSPDLPVATANLVDWCGWYIKQWLERLVQTMEVTYNDDGRPDTYQKVVEAVAKAGSKGMTSREIIHRCRAYRSLSAEKRDELIGLILSDGELVTVERKSKNNKSASYFVYRSFAKEVNS